MRWNLRDFKDANRRIMLKTPEIVKESKTEPNESGFFSHPKLTSKQGQEKLEPRNLRL